MTTLKGIDISNYQAGLNISQTGAQFAIMRATEGTTLVDKYCNGFVNQCKNLGLPWGTYHFFHGNGQAEADWYLKNIADYIGHGIMVLDWEGSPSQAAQAKIFLDRIRQKTGIDPIVYTVKSFLGSAGAIQKAGYPLWIAWPSPGSASYGSVSPWPYAVTWQYTWALHAAGYEIDGDYFYGDKATWNAFATGGQAKPDVDPTPTPTPTPTPEKDDLDMSDHLKFHTTKNQTFKKADEYQYLWLDDEHQHDSVALKPAKITGVVYVELSGLTDKDSFYIHAGSYDVKKETGGNKIVPVTENKDDRYTGEPAGWFHRTIPFVWDLGDQAKGYDYRALRFQVKASTTKAVIENARVEGFITYK